MIKTILRLEDLTILIASIYFYHKINGNWLLFILLVFLVDISMVGYLGNKKAGAISYNFVHNYVLGIVVTFAGILLNNSLILGIGLILIAHVAMDRGLIGMGLKYPTSFKYTHLHKL